MRKLATTVTALAAVATMSLTGVASAATSGPVGPAATKSQSLERSAKPGTSTPEPAGPGRTTTDVYVTSAPTGDGPADQSECDMWALVVNQTYADAAEVMAGGDSAAAADIAADAEALEDKGMDRGCFFVY